MKDMGIDEGSKGVTTSESNSEVGPEVKGHRTESRFRAVAARVNHLCQDRTDKQFIAKEISWFTAKRVAKYLKDDRGSALEYKYQELPKKVAIWSDIDFAGCRRTRNSSSGEVAMTGSLCITS